MACNSGFAADVTFNFPLNPIAESDPLAGSLTNPTSGCTPCVYGDVWVDNGYVYLGTDVNAGGMNIFSIDNPANPIYLTRYPGDQFEDVEVWDGIGYFASDVTTSASGTGVDIVDLRIPSIPTLMNRFNGADCTAAGCGHNKVHTLSVVGDYLYTSDNATDVIKVTKINVDVDPGDPSNITVNPQVVKSIDLGLATGTNSHEVIVRNNRLFVASKDNASSTCCGWTHIYDVSNPANPVLLKGFQSGPRSHTSLPSADGNTLIVAEERPNGNVNIYDISMINSANDPDSPLLLSVLNRTNVGIDAHSPHHPHLHGNLLFLPWYEAGLQVFNITNRESPVHVGSFDTFPGTSTAYNGNWGVDLSLGLKRVFLSDRSRGLIVVDASGVLAQGDYDQNMVVNGADYTAWRNTYGSGSSGLHAGAFADGNYNGVVDAADYVLYRKNFGNTGPVGQGSGAFNILTNVPEPATIFLLAFGASLIFLRHRARRAEAELARI